MEEGTMEPTKRLFILRYATGTMTEAALAAVKDSLPSDTVFVPIAYEMPAKLDTRMMCPTVDVH